MNKCNCRDKLNCPLNGNCLQKCIVHRATVKSDGGEVNYLGTSDSEFKQRFVNHKKSLKKRISGN